MAVIGQLIGRSALTAEADTLKLKDRAEPDIPNRDVILSYLGLLAQGHTEYSAVSILLEDEEASRLSLCLSVRVPSEGTLRQRIDQIGDRLRSPILRSNADIFRKIHTMTNVIPATFSGLCPQPRCTILPKNDDLWG